MRRFPIVAALGALVCTAPALAQRQADALTVTVEPTRLGSRDCSRAFSVTIQARILGQPATGLSGKWDITVARGNARCEDGESLGVEPTEDVTNRGTYRVGLRGAEIFEAATGQTCPTDDVSTDAKICAIWTNDDDNRVSNSAKVTIDTRVPDRPRITGIQPGDRALHVSFEPASGGEVASWHVCHKLVLPGEEEELAEAEAFQQGTGGFGGIGGFGGAGGTGGVGGIGGIGGTGGVGGTGGTGGFGGTGGVGGFGGTGGVGGFGGAGGEGGTAEEFVPDRCQRDIAGAKRNFRLGGLVNGQTYLVAVRAVSANGNLSPFSAPRTGVPTPTDDFLDRYRQAGGEEEGGCSTASSVGAWPWIGILLLALWWRRGR